MPMMRRAAATLLATCTAQALAEGTAEHALLIVDPDNPASMYLANYYKAARDLPDSHVLYMEPAAVNYDTFVAQNVEGLLGHLSNASIHDVVDYAVIAPSDRFFVAVPAGLITDTCSPVSRFSLSAAYTLALIPNKVQSGMAVTRTNKYFRANNGARSFSSQITWEDGLPSQNAGAESYFIGAQLGYLGERGNSVAELLAMIDRSVSADGSRPAGTFYYMTTTDVARSGPRDPLYPQRVADLAGLGASATNLNAVLPTATDCLGIMTGWAAPDIDNANLTIVPGAFCDHLTSWAATFDIASQTKLSRWIAKGASGSWGAVQEPCNYPGKFPDPRIHVLYYKGLTLGEAALRVAQHLPFQSLLYGDPLTRPFAYLPAVSVPDAPVTPVSGVITLTPVATNANPDAGVADLRLLVDGRTLGSALPGTPFEIDTTRLSDGWHDLRVLAADDSITRVGGRWVGELQVANNGRSVGLVPMGGTSGDLSTSFSFDVTAVGSGVQEVRLVSNNRVLAAAPGASAVLTTSGLQLGAGPVRVFAEAVLGGGRFVRSSPLTLDVAFVSGTPAGAAPTAHGYRKYVRGDSPAVVELPATYDNDADPLAFTIVAGPAQASLAGAGPYRILRPDAGAQGTDALTFRVSSSAGTSADVTVTIVYGPCPADVDGDGRVTIDDLLLVLGNFGTPSGAERGDGDLDGDGDVDLDDLLLVLGGFSDGCP